MRKKAASAGDPEVELCRDYFNGKRQRNDRYILVFELKFARDLAVCAHAERKRPDADRILEFWACYVIEFSIKLLQRHKRNLRPKFTRRAA